MSAWRWLYLTSVNVFNDTLCFFFSIFFSVFYHLVTAFLSLLAWKLSQIRSNAILSVCQKLETHRGLLCGDLNSVSATEKAANTKILESEIRVTIINSYIYTKHAFPSWNFE